MSLGIALIFGLVNAIVGTFVRIVAFPLYVLTLGLISFIVNGLLLLLVAWIMRGRTLRLHGAEHRAIAAAESRQLAATWLGEARPSRFSPRCGTNFAALALPVTAAIDAVWPFAPAPWARPALLRSAARPSTDRFQRFLRSRFLRCANMNCQFNGRFAPPVTRPQCVLSRCPARRIRRFNSS